MARPPLVCFTSDTRQFVRGDKRTRWANNGPRDTDKSGAQLAPNLTYAWRRLKLF
jgi:hypothetical protein